MMDQAIKDFPKQFEYDPVIENVERFRKKEKFIVCGMGGSNLAAGLLKISRPTLDIVAHRNYGLPQTIQGHPLDNPRDALGFGEYLVIASSYSGNTEEVIDAFHAAREKEMAVAVVSTGGKLIELAKEHTVPYIQMPSDMLQPRLAIGFSVRSLMKFMGDEEGLAETRSLPHSLDGGANEDQGKKLARTLQGKIPIIYSSDRNQAIAYNWKVILNETGKIPTFCNVFPELNHNEMTGFDVVSSTKLLSEKFHFVFLRDKNDHERILKRMDMTKQLYSDRGFGVEILDLVEGSIWNKIFSSLLTAHWTAFALAQSYGVEADEVPMVEEFKELLQK